MSQETSENERLVQFSDGIIAVTITLLALDIRIPIPTGELSDPALLEQFRLILPRIGAYALSFVVIATFWVAHRRKFEHIVRSNSALIWVNFAFLLVMGLIPLCTDVLADNGGAVATIAYAAVVALVSLLLAATGYVARHRNLIAEAHRHDREHLHPWLSLGAASVFIASIPVALVDAETAKYVWLALIPINIWQGRPHRAG